MPRTAAHRNACEVRPGRRDRNAAFVPRPARPTAAAARRSPAARSSPRASRIDQPVGELRLDRGDGNRRPATPARARRRAPPAASRSVAPSARASSPGRLAAFASADECTFAAKSRSSIAASSSRAWATISAGALAIAMIGGSEILALDDLGEADDRVERSLDLVDQLAERIRVREHVLAALRCAPRGGAIRAGQSRDSRQSGRRSGRRPELR